MVGTKKLATLWVGPYQVLEVINSNVYKLALPTSLHLLHPVFNISILKPYHGTIILPPDSIQIDGDLKYKVAEILAHRHASRCKRLEFLVSFLGYDSSHNEWLPESHLCNAPELLAVYKALSGLEWVGVQGLSRGCWLTPAGTILVIALTYPFGESWGSIISFGCSFKLVQLCPASISILCKPLHGLGGDGLTILNVILTAISYSTSCRKQQQCT